MNSTRLVVLSVFLFLASPAFSEGAAIFYRDSSGGITQESRQYAKTMAKAAEEQGYITLWLTFDFPFNVNMDEMSPEELAEQQAQVANYVGEVLGPLVAAKQVWHPRSGPFVAGPGCKVRATSNALKTLFRDDRVIQIVSLD